jgi:hypothetical protein
MTTENTAVKQLREATNNTHIEGIVADVRIEEKNYNGVDSISGEIDIKVSEDSVHTIKVFSNKINKKGTESGLYKGIQTIKNEFKSIEKNGIEDADKVRIDAGQIGRNDYYGEDGLLRSFPQLKANFVNRVQSNDVFEPKAEFSLEMYIFSINEEKDKDQESTGRLLIKGFVPVYEGKVIPFDLVVNEDNAEYVSNTYEKGQTATFYGEIVNRMIITKTEVKVGFGKPKEDVKRFSVREYLVNSATDPLDADEENSKAYNPKEIKKAVEAREKALIVLKDKKKNKPEPAKEKNPFKKETNKPAVDISDEDLPF